MSQKALESVAMTEVNDRWGMATSRVEKLYARSAEIRSEFARDYTRILHCTAYRRLKHKTQVFFATTNDHICTRIEHVNHVNSVSKTISNYLGLNSELCDAISIGHDLGHAPFGHEGEGTLRKIIAEKFQGLSFWHERNSLRFVDHIETLEGPNGLHTNLNLTYAVRDGIVCHCGEIDQNGLQPRQEFLDLNTIEKPNQFAPYTWEGCVVKISDKIAYLGRDIEDANTLGLLDPDQVDRLDVILRRHGVEESFKLNNTVLIHTFIMDLCGNSSVERGVGFSDPVYDLMSSVKDFCYGNIYAHEKVNRYKKFVRHIIEDLFGVLLEMVNDLGSSKVKMYYPSLYRDFRRYLECYSNLDGGDPKYANIAKIYRIESEKSRYEACVDFVSGMTDQYAIKKFKESITF